MKIGNACIILLAVLICLLGVFIQVKATGAGGVVLLTPEEGKQLRLTEEEWNRPLLRMRGPRKGPRIAIKSPPVKETSQGPVIEVVSPIDLVVSFEKNLAPVNMSSLEVTARKGIFSKSLTDRLKPFIRETSLEAKGVQLPTGKFKIQISIADKNKEETVQTYRVIVK